MRALGRLLLVLGLLVWLAALARVVGIWLTEPPPAREITFVAVDGRITGEPVSCRGSAFVVDEFIWQGCAQQRANGAVVRAGLVRFDLRRGLGEMFWNTRRADPWTIEALAKRADGDLAVVWADGTYLVRRDGGLRLLREGSRPMAGIAWIDESLELVDSGAEPTIHTYEKGRGWRSRKTVVPRHPPDTQITLDLAYRSGGRWNLIFVRHPVLIAGGDPVPVEIFHGTETQPPTPIETTERTPSFRSPADNSPSRRTSRIAGPWLDRGPGSAVNLNGAATLPLERRQERWRPVELPPLARGGRWFFDYLVEPDGLETLPRTTAAGSLARVGGRWFQLLCNERCRLRRLGAYSGPPLARSVWLEREVKVLPATDGGLWLLGRHSNRYIKVSSGLERIDGMSFTERARLLFRRDPAKLRFLERFAAAKLLSVPVVLALYPLLLGILLISGRPRQGGGRSRRFLVASLLYLGCAGGFGLWFWQLTGYF